MWHCRFLKKVTYLKIKSIIKDVVSVCLGFGSICNGMRFKTHLTGAEKRKKKSYQTHFQFQKTD